MTIEKLESESYLDWKYRVLIDKVNGDLDASWEDIEKELSIGMAKDSIRKGSVFLPEFRDYLTNKLLPQDKLPDYKESLDYNKDGTYSSDKLVQLNKDKLKDPEYMLNAHGFDPNEWELVSARNNIWNVSAGQNPNKTLYSSRISVKPKVSGFNVEKMVQLINEKVKPVTVTKNDNNRKGGLLEIPLVDMHWGIADYNYYLDTLLELIDLISSKRWDTIYFNVGNDLLHTNTFTGQTANGTQIEQVDLEKAWKNAFSFYTTLFTEALKNSDNVNADYICGNHDKEITYGFVKALEVKFPEVKFDSSIKNKKLFVWKKVAILSAHGDKGANRLSKALLAEHGKTIAQCDVIEIHTGHLHFEQSKDDHGIVTRTLPTKAITDTWHQENSFVGSKKSFQIFEYTEDMLKTIYHV